MPCRDYEGAFGGSVDRTEYYTAQRDKLARIACRAMTALEKLGRLDLVADKESADWFKKHKADDAAAEARRRADRDRARTQDRLKASALSKLSDAERKALGVK